MGRRYKNQDWVAMFNRDLLKVTPGFVIQRFNPDSGEWIDQEFVAGDRSERLQESKE